MKNLQLPTCVLMLLASYGCMTRKSPIQDSATKGATEIEAPDLKLGYDSQTSTTKTADCLDQSVRLGEPQSIKTIANFEENDEFAAVTNTASLSKKLGINGSFDITWSEINGSVRGSWVNEIEGNTSSFSWLLSRVVYKDIKVLPDGVLYTINPRFKGWTWDDFVNQCGDSVITKVGYGGRFHAMMTLSFTSRSARDEWNAALKASVGSSIPFMNKVALEAAANGLSNEAKRSTIISFKYLQIGGKSSPAIFANPEAILKCNLGGVATLADGSTLEGIDYCKQVIAGLMEHSATFANEVDSSIRVRYEASSYNWSGSEFGEEKCRKTTRSINTAMSVGEYNQWAAKRAKVNANFRIGDNLTEANRNVLSDLSQDIAKNIRSLEDNLRSCAAGNSMCVDPKGIITTPANLGMADQEFNLAYIGGGIGGDSGTFSAGPLCPNYLRGLRASIRSKQSGTTFLSWVEYICDSGSNTNTGGGLRFSTANNATTNAYQKECPATKVLVGIQGKSARPPTGSSQNPSLGQLALLCAKRDGTAEEVIDLYNDPENAVGDVFSSRCFANQVVSGVEGLISPTKEIVRLKIVCRT